MAISKIGVQATGFAEANVGLQIPNISLENRAASAANGTIFFNTSNNAIEVYANGAWTSVGAPNDPTIAAISGNFVASGAVNTSISLTGTNFLTGQGQVRFVATGVDELVSITPTSTTSITCLVPLAVRNLTANTTVTISYINSSGLASGGFQKNLDAAPTGGTISADGNNRIHMFTSTGTFSIKVGTLSSVKAYVIGGGGAGGTGNTLSDDCAGGGGGGGMSYKVWSSLNSGDYSVVVGAGGIPTSTAGGTGGSGGSSSFNTTQTASGGGGGKGNTSAGDPGGGNFGSTGGTGGSGSNGDVNGTGGNGSAGTAYQNTPSGGSGSNGGAGGGGGSEGGNPDYQAGSGGTGSAPYYTGGGGGGANDGGGAPAQPISPGGSGYYTGGSGGDGGEVGGTAGGGPAGGPAGFILSPGLTNRTNTGGGGGTFGGGGGGGASDNNARTTGGYGGGGGVVIVYTLV